MDTKRVLLMHITNVTGHRSASRAIEHALRQTNGAVQIRAIDAFNYINPYLLGIIYNLYIFIIKALPGVWDYLYDNEAILRRIDRIRSLIHRLSERKIKRLFDDFPADIVVCTQAFPCAMLADYKRRHNLNIPLMGVLTDFAPHIYWLNDYVDIYIVPTPEVTQNLINRGIVQQRQRVLGIPIDTKFAKPAKRQETFRRLGLDAELPVILIMGGGQGLGPIKEIVRSLDRLRRPVQLMVVCGTNRYLYKWLSRNRSSFTKPLFIIGYTDHIDDLMAVSTFIVTKPGGLTSAEALSKSLPIIIVNPLPGQESRNTRFLLERGAALRVDSFVQLQSLAGELLSDRARLAKLRQRAGAQAVADSAQKIAQLILDMVGNDVSSV